MSFDSTKVTDTIGGQSQIDFFLIRIKSDASGYDIIDPANVFTSPTYPSSPDLPVVAVPTRANSLLYSLKYIGDHKISFDDKGIPSIDGIDNYDSGKQFGNAILKVGLPGGSSSRARPEYYIENHIKRGGSVVAGKTVLAICYDQLDPIEDEVQVNAIMGGVKVTSLGGHKDEEYVKPELKVAGTTPEANISIPEALFDSNLAVVTGAQTFYKENLIYSEYKPKGVNAI